MAKHRFALSPQPRPRWRGLVLALPLLFACQDRGGGPEGEGEANSGAAAEAPPAQGATVGTITKIRGSRGVSSPDLPQGAFLGEGAELHAGQWLELPRGTRVELELGSGVRLRLDEDSRLQMPEAVGAESTASVQLDRGRLVVLSDASPLEVRAAEERLLVERGEVELHHAGDTRHYGVVQGRATLRASKREIPLGPGASISTPLAPTTRPETPPDETILAAAIQPSLSLAPLHQSAWTAAFEDSSRLAATIPEGVGSLVARRAGSQVERQHLRLSEQKVKVTISGRIARTEIEQAFFNESGQTLEGIYQFPLPSDASISDLQLLVGDTWMQGEMLEKSRAEQIFRSIVDATVPRDPALLQWKQGGVFKLNIFPIPGKGERRIKIAYTQVLPAVGDALRYRYPMGGSGATATEIGDFDFSVSVDGEGLDAQTLAGVRTPMAELQRTQVADGAGLELAMHETDYQPRHELGVDIPLPEEQRRVMAATHRDRDGQGYFMLTLRPELELEAERKPVHYAFVLDRSHGTTPELWAAAEGLTKAMVDTLEPEDRFTLLACDTACEALPGGLQPKQGAEPMVDAFIRDQELAGASDIGNMLASAGATLGEADAAVEQVVVYLGDGAPSSGALTPDELGARVQRDLAHLRVQAVALGARSDLLVLDHLVRQSGGDLISADARDDLPSLARELRLRAQVPVARDLELELPPGLVEVYPKALPALRPGDSLTLVGKLREGDAAALRGDVRLHGRSGAAGRQVDERFQVMLDPEYSGGGAKGVHAHLPRTWAQQEITYLTQTGGAEVRDRIIELSREYNVLSRYTALLVLENERMYREFKVARRAGDKDSWDGKLKLGGGDEALPSSDEAKAKETATTTSEALPAGAAPTPMEEEKREDASAADMPAMEPETEAEPDPAPMGGFDDDFDDFDNDANQQALGPSDAKDQGEFAEAEEGEFFDGEFDDAPAAGGESKADTKGRGKSGSSSGGTFAEPPPPKKSKEKKPLAPSSKPSAPRGDVLDDLGGDGGGWGGGGAPSQQPGGAWGGGGWERNWPKMVLRDTSGPSVSDRQKIAELQRIRDADPTSRKAHRELVRRAARANDPGLLAFAAAWAAADPDHVSALLAHADALAAAGDPVAMRAYASAVEVSAFSRKLHERMAEALLLAGDFERACSHRRALMSIEPDEAERVADYVECMVMAGRLREAQTVVLASAALLDRRESKAARKRADGALARGVRADEPRVHGSPDLRAELRWGSAENLDLAFVDRRGRRLSVMRPQSVRVREEQDGAERVEVMTMLEVQGTVFVEVTRPESEDPRPVGARLTVKTANGKRSWNLSLVPGTQRVALTRWE